MKANNLNAMRSMVNTAAKKSQSEIVMQSDFFTAHIDKSVQIIDIDDLYDAPASWNKFPSIRESNLEKYLETKMSIANSGVFNPLIVWEYPESQYTGDNTKTAKYMILSGHNRCHISRELAEEYPENADKYRKLSCKVYGKDEIDEIKAREIINDTNLLQRDSIPNKLRIEILNDRLVYAESQKTPKGETIQQLADQLGLKKTAIYEDMQIKHSLIEPFQEMYFSESIKKKEALALLRLPKKTQEWLYEEYDVNDIINADLRKIKPQMSEREIREIIEVRVKSEATKIVKIEIPVAYEAEFKQMVDTWKKAKKI